MARTNKYMNQISNRIQYVNKKIREIERKFGIDSEQYSRYVNVATAALPPDAYRLTESGQIRIRNTQAVREQVRLGQVRALTNLPTAKQSMTAAKLSIAKNNLQIEGIDHPDTDEIKAEALTISDEQVLQELAAKAFIQNLENAKGKLHYSESVRAGMQRKGKKSYTELMRIIQKGEKRDAQKERKAEYQRQYRAAHREEVNRKQREYRARKRAEQNR